MVGRTRGVALVLSVALMAVGAGAPSAIAKKKKRGPIAATALASVPLSPGAQQTATANCPAKTHITGGGWAVTPIYNANGTTSLVNDTGTRINHLQSSPASALSWTAGAAAFNLPSNPGTFTSVARCENNSLGRTALGVSGTTTVPVGQESTTDLNCSPGTHVLTGGFSFTPAGDLASPGAFRAIVVESRRLNATTWRIHLINPVGAPSPVTLVVNVVCEATRKGVGVSETSAVAAIPNDERATATATCTGKKHTIGGGFLITPHVGPAVGIDQMQPVGAKAWQVGLYEYPAFNLPAGSTLTAFNYCKNNALPKKKRKKKQRKK